MDHSIQDRNQRLSEYFNSNIKKGEFPGIQYIAVDSVGKLFQYFGGWADIENRIPMDSSTTMMAYSMTKPFTAAGIMQLVEAGKLHLDDSVYAYFPSMPYGHSMTIRHLLSQTSGIPNPIPLRWVHLAQHHNTFNEERVLDAVMQDNAEPLFTPGSKYGYSNISYWILGKIVERVSGKPFHEYMNDHIFAPLHVRSEAAAFTIVGNAPHAKGYLKKYSFMNLAKSFLIGREYVGEYEGDWLHINDHYLNGPGFGGLITTAQAVATFLQDQLQHESVLFGNQTRGIFFTQQKTNGGDLIGMTLGWHIGHLDGVQYYFKEGGGGGYHAEMRIYPGRGIGTVIMVNETSSRCTDVLSTIDRELLEK